MCFCADLNVSDGQNVDITHTINIDVVIYQCNYCNCILAAISLLSALRHGPGAERNAEGLN